MVVAKERERGKSKVTLERDHIQIGVQHKDKVSRGNVSPAGFGSRKVSEWKEEGRQTGSLSHMYLKLMSEKL